MSKKMTAATAADVLAAIPHQLGYTPVESFVFITLRGNASGATLRLAAPAEIDPADYAQVATHYLLADEEADGALLIVYTDEQDAAGAAPYRTHADAVRTELDGVGVTLRQAWLVTSNGWTDYPEGSQMWPLSEIGSSAIAAEMVYRGSNAHRAIIDPDYDGQLSTVDIFTAGRSYKVTDALDMDEAPMRAARALWTDTLAATTEPDTDTAAALIGIMQHKPTRDRVLADLANTNDGDYAATLLGQGTESPAWERMDAAEVLLTALVTHSPEAERAPLYTALGWIQWYKGRGSRAGAYLDRAQQAVPGYELARLLNGLLERGILPAVAINPDTAYHG